MDIAQRVVSAAPHPLAEVLIERKNTLICMDQTAFYTREFNSERWGIAVKATLRELTGEVYGLSRYVPWREPIIPLPR